MIGTLYVVATPIGNLEDITERALSTLRACDRVLAEDTRRTRALCTHFGIHPKHLDTLNAHATDGDLARVVAALERGESVAIVTDAGTPAVSDPGEALVKRAIAAGARVVPIPGASAVIAALSASGVTTGAGFRFLGFLPRDNRGHAEAVGRASDTPEAVVVFEAANRLTSTLAAFAAATPARRACVARELTKVHEELVRGTLAELAADPREWIGEIVLVLDAYDGAARAAITDEQVDARIAEELAKGAHAKTVAERVAAWSGRPRRSVYERVVALRGAR